MAGRLPVEGFLNVLRTADALLEGLAATLKPYGLSHTQYNVLRILRGATPEGLPCGEIAGRLLTRDPDITRLLDRLESHGLVSRSREPGDRRVVLTRITADGLATVVKLDRPVAELHQRQLGHLGDRKLRSLIALLEAARENHRRRKS